MTQNKENVLASWKETDLFYNYNQENYRKKIINLKKSQVSAPLYLI